jgi:phosphoribosylformylglycinamidine cyclo-ligase
MARTFNCGIGFVLVVAPGDVDATLDLMRGAGEAAFVIGQVVARPAGAPGTVIV